MSAASIPKKDLDDYLNSREAATYLRIFKSDGITPCSQTIRNLVNLKKLKGYKPYGEKLLLKKSELKNKIESSRTDLINAYFNLRR